jgi:hypothetical protein
MRRPDTQFIPHCGKTVKYAAPRQAKEPAAAPITQIRLSAPVQQGAVERVGLGHLQPLRQQIGQA